MGNSASIAIQKPQESVSSKIARGIARTLYFPFYSRHKNSFGAASFLVDIEDKGRIRGTVLGFAISGNGKIAGVSVSVLSMVNESNGVSLAVLNDAFRDRGLKLGIFSRSGGWLRGVSLGVVSATVGADKSSCYADEATSWGFVGAGLYSDVTWNSKGVVFSGVWANVFNNANGGVIGAITSVSEKLTGFALGLFNFAESFTGFRLGLINVSNEPSKGVDVGLLNFDNSAPWYLRCVPLVRVHFGKT
ncbi:MAG: hypothetical protein NTV88_00500, partial [Candidatus Micrarchaeota archaeon]|nr:hypothetical protein [Candidatus Micrarchaeota archaeon]